MNRKLSALILAAGKGVRMKSDLPKVLHPVLGRPMVGHVIDAVRAVGADDVTLVVGFGRETLMQAFAGENVKFTVQAEQLGTGHAVQCFCRDLTAASGRPEAAAGAAPREHHGQPEHLLVVCGDTPLLSRQTLATMVERHFAEKPACTMLTLTMAEPGLYGRILRDATGRVTAIREAKDCTEEQKKIREINLAVYLFDGKALMENIFKLSNDNRQKEYYLTDLVEMFAAGGLPVIAVEEKDELSTLGINSRVDLARVSQIMRDQVVRRHLENGVTIVDPGQVVIEPTVEIAAETTLWPGVTLTGKTVIGSRCTIGPNTLIADSRIGNGVEARCCVIEHGASIADGTRLVPFTTVQGTEQTTPKNHS